MSPNPSFSAIPTSPPLTVNQIDLSSSLSSQTCTVNGNRSGSRELDLDLAALEDEEADHGRNQDRNRGLDQDHTQLDQDRNRDLDAYPDRNPGPDQTHICPPESNQEPSRDQPSTSNNKSPLSGFRRRISATATRYHARIPGLCRVPLRATAIIAELIAVNILAWVVVGIILASHPALASTAGLAYVLGLRHALDADHISAIDLMTRRLIASGQRPVSVGTFFSLGHSTIVVITSIVVAATAAAVSSKFGSFSHVGGIIGTSVSAGFLIILGIANVYILYNLVIQLKALIRNGGHSEMNPWTGAGCLFHLFKKLFNLIDRPWKMYPLGILFGLGFDTSSEVALLGIASIQGASGTSMWLILIFPLLFTAGMCLLDTTDGALMMTLYTSTALARDQIAIFYYSIVLTLITICAATAIGTIQLLTLILNVADPPPSGPFWDGVNVAANHYDIIGASICGSFIIGGVTSILLYKPWRRRVNRRMSVKGYLASAENDDQRHSNRGDNNETLDFFIATIEDEYTNNETARPGNLPSAKLSNE